MAAVNEYGFRGYSQPSHAFTLPNSKSNRIFSIDPSMIPLLAISYADPKPPKPPNDLKIVAKQYDGRRYVSVKLIWCPSKSNLPVEKYKIFWSRYVNSREGSIDTDEVYVKDVSALVTHPLLLGIYMASLSALSDRPTKWS